MGLATYIIILEVILLYNPIEAYKECCLGDNIFDNTTCLDGSNITGIECEDRIMLGPSMEHPLYLIFEEDDVLKLTDADESGYLFIPPEEYCITKDRENQTLHALVCVGEKEEQAAGTVAFDYIKAICAFITTLFLLAIFIVYVAIPELQDVEGKCILNMVGSLLVGYIIFSIDPLMSLIEPDPCVIAAFLRYISLLCCSCWLSVLSFHLWKMAVGVVFQSKISWFIAYLCYGYGLPLLLVVTATITHATRDTDLDIGPNECLFEGNMSIFIHFYGPATIITIICVILQLWAAKKIWWDYGTKPNSPIVRSLRKKSLMYLHLLLVLGIIQILALFSYLSVGREVIWVLMDCRNCLVGGVMFFIFVPLRNKVLKALARKRRICCVSFPEHWERLVDEESESLEGDQRVLMTIF